MACCVDDDPPFLKGDGRWGTNSPHLSRHEQMLSPLRSVRCVVVGGTPGSSWEYSCDWFASAPSEARFLCR